MKTKTKDKLVKGYAKLRSNLVIANIQNREATKADKKPEKTKGSHKSFNKKKIFGPSKTGTQST